MNYLDFPSLFADDDAKNLAARTIDNLFRKVISRFPSLILRARASGYSSVREFIEDKDSHLSEEDYARLWNGLKYSHGSKEGRLSVNTVRDAICEAENRDKMSKDTQGVDFLGGRVLKRALELDLSSSGWDLLYRFVSPFMSTSDASRGFGAEE